MHTESSINFAHSHVPACLNIFVSARTHTHTHTHTQVLTPFQQVCLAAGSRKEMEEWTSAFKLAAVKSKHSVKSCYDSEREQVCDMCVYLIHNKSNGELLILC